MEEKAVNDPMTTNQSDDTSPKTAPSQSQMEMARSLYEDEDNNDPGFSPGAVD